MKHEIVAACLLWLEDGKLTDLTFVKSGRRAFNRFLKAHSNASGCELLTFTNEREAHQCYSQSNAQLVKLTREWIECELDQSKYRSFDPVYIKLTKSQLRLVNHQTYELTRSSARVIGEINRRNTVVQVPICVAIKFNYQAVDRKLITYK